MGLKDYLAKRKHNKQWKGISGSFDSGSFTHERNIPNNPAPTSRELGCLSEAFESVGITAKEFCDNIKPF